MRAFFNNMTNIELKMILENQDNSTNQIEKSHIEAINKEFIELWDRLEKNYSEQIGIAKYILARRRTIF